MVEIKMFRQDSLDESTFEEVKTTANKLLEYLNQKEILKKIKLANMPGNSSALVQNVFLEEAKKLGFQSEKKGLFINIPTPNLRPDYYMSINNTGIIIEVERGKTVMNNMDMLDFWKCHVCQKANHLFLFVPSNLKHNVNRKGYDCFKIVSNRMTPFFENKNYTNVQSLWIFGY